MSESESERSSSSNVQGSSQRSSSTTQTFLALAWVSGRNSQPSRARGVARRAVARVIVDWDTIANGLNGPLSRSPALLIFLALRLALDKYGATSLEAILSTVLKTQSLMDNPAWTILKLAACSAAMSRAAPM